MWWLLLGLVLVTWWTLRLSLWLLLLPIRLWLLLFPRIRRPQLFRLRHLPRL
jgi:hypothetical protein